MENSLLELWAQAGAFARFIIIVLAIMSVYSLAVGSGKWWRLHKSKKETKKFAPEFGRFLQEEQLDAAIELAESKKISHVARVLGEALSEVKPLLQDRATVTSADINSAERATERQMLILHADLKRIILPWAATPGSVSPVANFLTSSTGSGARMSPEAGPASGRAWDWDSPFASGLPKPTAGRFA